MVFWYSLFIYTDTFNSIWSIGQLRGSELATSHPSRRTLNRQLSGRQNQPVLVPRLPFEDGQVPLEGDVESPVVCVRPETARAPLLPR